MFTLHVVNLEYMKVSLFEIKVTKQINFHDILIFCDAAPVFYTYFNDNLMYKIMFPFSFVISHFISL